MTTRVIVTGTGTEIGKTHVADALVRRLADGRRVAAVKPVESGVADAARTDAARLDAAASFHVKHAPPYAFTTPVSPHLAARLAGIEISPSTVGRFIDDVSAGADVVVIELAGGLFSPVTDALTNADLVLDLGPAFVVLVVPDRLGVLHDTAAACLAARSIGVIVDAIVVNAPQHPDASTGTNTGELRRLRPGATIIGPVPRAPAPELARTSEIGALAAKLLA